MAQEKEFLKDAIADGHTNGNYPRSYIIVV